MSQYFYAMTTVATEADAAQLAQTLVEQRLVACAQVIPGLRSFYHWKGKVCDEAECLITMKTTREQIQPLKQVFPALHPYEAAELIFLPIEDGSPSYLQWIEASLKK